MYRNPVLFDEDMNETIPTGRGILSRDDDPGG